MKYKSKLTIKIEYAGNQNQSAEFNYERSYSESIDLYKLFEKLAFLLAKYENVNNNRAEWR